MHDIMSIEDEGREQKQKGEIQMKRKAMEMIREFDDIELGSGRMTKNAVTVNINKMYELAPSIMEEIFDKKYSDCEADVSIELGEIDITIFAEDETPWGNEDLEEMIYDGLEEEAIAIMEYMKGLI